MPGSSVEHPKSAYFPTKRSRAIDAASRGENLPPPVQAKKPSRPRGPCFWLFMAFAVLLVALFCVGLVYWLRGGQEGFLVWLHIQPPVPKGCKSVRASQAL